MLKPFKKTQNNIIMRQVTFLEWTKKKKNISLASPNMSLFKNRKQLQKNILLFYLNSILLNKTGHSN